MHSRHVLSEHGNMSSATVLFILRDALDAGAKGRVADVDGGLGFTAGMMIVEMNFVRRDSRERCTARSFGSWG